MSTETPVPKRRNPWGVLLIIGLLICLGVVVIPELSVVRQAVRENQRKTSTQAQVTQVRAAVKAYRVEYGIPLTGDPARVLAVLRGDNPRQIVFFETEPSAFNAKGELIDPWGTPYLFDLTDLDFPRIWSSGKNRRDDGGAPGSDDVVSWR